MGRATPMNQATYRPDSPRVEGHLDDPRGRARVEMSATGPISPPGSGTCRWSTGRGIAHSRRGVPAAPSGTRSGWRDDLRTGLRRVPASRGHGQGARPGGVRLAFPWFADRLRRQFEVHHALWGGEPSGDGTRMASYCPAATPRPSEDRSRPDRASSIPGHRIISVLGRGGMGIVYKSWQVSLRHSWPSRCSTPGRRRSEVGGALPHRGRGGARFHHPNIIQIYELGELEG